MPGSSRAAAYDAAGDTVEVLAVFAFGTADPGGAHRFAHAPRFSSGWRGIWLAFEKVMGGLRLAVRTLWRAPGFTAVAVLVIALGAMARPRRPAPAGLRVPVARERARRVRAALLGNTLGIRAR